MAKLKLREMGSRYLFIIAYVWLEKVLSRGDYARVSAAEPDRPAVQPVADRSGIEVLGHG
jgi:dolichol-phosphate mannosyltransferase